MWPPVTASGAVFCGGSWSPVILTFFEFSDRFSCFSAVFFRRYLGVFL
jgi:hypothetical protein